MENKTFFQVPVELSSTDEPLINVSVTNKTDEENAVYFNFRIDNNHCGFFILEKNWKNLIENIEFQFLLKKRD